MPFERSLKGLFRLMNYFNISPSLFSVFLGYSFQHDKVNILIKNILPQRKNETNIDHLAIDFRLDAFFCYSFRSPEKRSGGFYD
jgi:hypothetical protein